MMRKPLATLILLCVGLTGAFIPNEGRANTIALPEATFLGVAHAGSTNEVDEYSDDKETHTAGTLKVADGAYSNGSITLAAHPGPLVETSLHLGPVPAGRDNSSSSNLLGDVKYSFEIVGPDGNVPLLAQGNAGFSVGATPLGDPNGYSLAMSVGVSELGNLGFWLLDGYTGPAKNQLFSFSQTFNAVVNSVYTVEIASNIIAAISGDSGGGEKDLSAWIDPKFTVQAPGYELLLSPGVGNSIATTPIPAALPLFASALGGLAFVSWRRKRLGGRPASA